MLLLGTLAFGAWTVPATVTADRAGHLSEARLDARSTFGPRRARPAGLFGVPFVSAFAPQITVTKTDQLLVDTDGDGLADPGDTIRYTIEIANAVGAMDATGSVFTDTFDANTTLVAGSENASPLAYDGTASVSGAPVTITLTGADGDGDALTFSITNSPAEGTLGAVTQVTPTTAEVTYTQTNPTATSDGFTFRVNDGTVDSNEDATVLLTLGNPAPVVTITDTAPLTYTEGDAALQVTSDLTVSDNSAIASATVSITTGFETSQDVLAATASGAIVTGDISYDSGTGVLTIAPGSPASTADFQAVLRGVTYENTSMNPTKAGTVPSTGQAGPRTISFEVTDDGMPPPAMTNAPVSRDVDIVGVNDPPVLTASGTTTAFTEDGAAVVVDAAVTVADVDDTTLESATVSITNLQDGASETLGFVDQNSITGSYDSATGVLTLSGTASVANYQTALQSVTYDNSSDTPTESPDRVIAFVANDGDDDSNTATQTVSVTATNDAPVVTTAGTTTAFIEDSSGPVAVDATVSVTDADDTDLEGATVSITTGFETSQDVLGFVDQNGISGSYDGATGVLTLSGTASVANYQTALQSVTYDNTSDDPSKAAVALVAGDRTVAFVASDGDVDSNTALQTVSVTATNDAPVVTTAGTTTAFTEDGGPVVIDATVSVTDPDDTTLASASVTVTNLQDTGAEILAASPSGGIAAGDITYSAPTLTIAPAGGAPLADFIAVLQSVTYDNSSDTPTESPDRVIAFVANDGDDDSNTATQTVSVAATNDAPVVTTAGGTTAFTEDTSGPVIIDATVSVDDADDTDLEGATVSITTGFETSQDVLGFVDQNGITGSYDGATGVLALSGTSSVANYQTALQSVTYDNTSDDPSKAAVALVAGDRTVEFVAGDGDDDSNTALQTVSVTATNDAPVATTAGTTTPFTEDGGAVVVDATVTVSDADDTDLEGATVSITNLQDDTSETLGFVDQNGITGSYDSATGVLTLSGTSSVAHYQTALQNITYDNSSDDPTESPDRVISFVVNDGDVDSNTATQSVSVTAVNDPPMADDETFDDVPVNVVLEVGSTQASAPSVFVNAPTGVLDGDTDVDGGALTVGEVTGTATDSSAPFMVTTTNGGTVVMQADGTFTYLSAVGYTGATDSFTYKAFDGTDPSNDATVTINLTTTVWFIDNSASALAKTMAGTGQSNDPFTDQPSFNAVNDGTGTNPGMGDVIFIHTGGSSYDDGITLFDGQQLIGEGAGLTVGGLSIAAGTAPTLTNGSGMADLDAVSIEDDNTLRGFNIALNNSNIGDGIDGDFDGGTTLVDGVNITIGGDGDGIDLENQSGTFTFQNASITGSGDGGTIDIFDGDADFTFNAVTINKTGGDNISAGDLDNSTFSFDAASSITHNLPAASGIPAAVVVLYDNEGTCLFDFDNTWGTLQADGGFIVSNIGSATLGATLDIENPPSVTALGGAALLFEGVTVAQDGASGITFGTISSDEAFPLEGGVYLDAVDGLVTITGTTTITNAVDVGIFTIESSATFEGAVSVDNTLPRAAPKRARGEGLWTRGRPQDQERAQARRARLQTLAPRRDEEAGETETFAPGRQARGVTALPQQTKPAKALATQGDGVVIVNDDFIIDANQRVRFEGGLTIDVEGEGLGLGVFNDATTASFTFEVLDPGGTNSITSEDYSAVLMRGLNLPLTIGPDDVTFSTIQVTGTAEADGLGFDFIDGDTFDGGTVTVAGTLIGVDDGLAISNASATFAFGAVMIDDTGGDGIELDSNTGPISFTGTSQLGMTTGNAGQGINIDGGTGGFSFAAVNIDNRGAEGISITGGNQTGTFGAVTIDNQNASVSDGLNINGTTGGSVTFTSLDVAMGSVAANGVDLASNAAAVDIQGGSITGTSNAASFLISGGTANVDYDGTINNTSGRSVDVQIRMGGTVAFAGAIDDDGAGIFLDNNTGGTINFSGGMALDTGANTAFTATGGGTVEVCATNDCAAGLPVVNTIGATTALTTTALTITNTTIGSNGATFRSIDVNGGTNGIVLNNTGSSGVLTITGDGTVGGVLDGNNNGSGGTIQSTTADAISLMNTGPVTINQMQIGAAGALENIPQNGIRASGVNGLSVNHTDFINASGDDAGGGNDFAAIRLLNPVAGSTITLTHNLFNRSFEDHVRIENGDGSGTPGVAMGTISISENNFDDNDTSGQGDDAVLYVGDNSSNATIDIKSNRFFQSDGDHVQVALNGTADADVTIGGPNVADGNDMSATHATVLGSGITLSSGEGAGSTNFSGDLTFLIQNNDIQFPSAGAINVNLSASSTAGLRYSGTISNNTVGTQGSAGSGGFGIQATTNGAGTMNVDIDDNDVHGWDGANGIVLTARDGSNRLETNVRDNTITAPNPSSVNTEVGIEVASGALGGDTCVILVNLTGNAFDNTPDPQFGDMFFGTIGGGSVQISNYAGAANNQAQIESFVQTNNTGTPSVMLFQFGGDIEGTGSLPVNIGGLLSPAPVETVPSAFEAGAFALRDVEEAATGNREADTAAFALHSFTSTSTPDPERKVHTESSPIEPVMIAGLEVISSTTTQEKLPALRAEAATLTDLVPAPLSSPGPLSFAIESTRKQPTPKQNLRSADSEPVLLASSENDPEATASLLKVPVEPVDLPSMADIKAAFPQHQASCTAGTCTWAIGTLPAGRTITITVDVTVNTPLPAGLTEVANQGTLTADGNLTVVSDDPDTPAADDPTVTPVSAASMLAATKADALQTDNDGDGQADPGDTIRYTVVLTNGGDSGASDVVFTDMPDANTTLVVGSVTTTDGTIDTGNTAGDASVQVSVPMIEGGGGQATITFDVVVNAPFPATETQVANQGTATATGDPGTLTDDPDTAPPGDPTRTPIDVQADLSLTKTADTTTPDFGGEVTFTLTLSNDGPSQATAVVTDLMPAGLTYVSEDGDGAYDPATGQWQPGTLAVGASASLHLTARVETTLPVTNTAEVTSASLPDPDSTPADGTGDDYASVSLIPVAADLALDKEVIAFSGDRHGPGPDDDTVTATFLVTVTNHGPSTATGVLVSDPVPDGAVLEAAVPSQGTYDLLTETWAAGTLPVDGTATLTMTLSASASNNLYNLAEVSADQPDQNPANNLDGAHGQHDPEDLDRFSADLSLGKTVDNSEPGVGDEIVYTLRVLNSGPSTTDGVVVRDSLPDGLAFVSAQVTSQAGSCPECGYDAASGRWTINHLPKDSSAVIEITVQVVGTGEITNTAEVIESHLPDPDSVFGDGDPDDDDIDTAVVTVSTGKATSAVRSGAEGPAVRYELGSNYPNPFNPETVIPLSLPEAHHVTVEVYNLLGQRVAVLLDGPLAAGRHEVVWRAEDQPSGLYLVRMQAGPMQKVQRITLMK